MNKLPHIESDREKDLDIFLSSIKDLTSKEFDGHTDFELLRPEQKLNWLSEIARFFYEHHSKQKKDE